MALLSTLLLLILTGCGDKTDETAVAEANRAVEAVAADSDHGHDHGQATATGSAGRMTGEVLETMDAAGYTYARVGIDGEEAWVAGPKTALEVGQQVSLDQGMLMPDFHSKELDRTFEEIWFVAGYGAPGAPAAAGADAAAKQELERAHAGLGATADEAIEVAAAAGGQTVAGIFALGAGDDVLVRGKVVKANYGILGTNWYHVQDGSGEAGGNDITVTSATRVSVGDVVLVRGTLTLDKDFGAGYRYDRIVEDAELTVDSL